jgi:ribonuclease-3
MSLPVEALETKLQYWFRDSNLLRRALTHRSRSSEQLQTEDSGDNEPLEFLGDAILGFLTSEVLFLQNPRAREGELSQWKAQLVSSSHLHQCAIKLELGQYLLLGKGEERNGGRDRKTLLADAVEAVLAALYLDGGIEAARMFVQDHILNGLENASVMESLGQLNSRSVLQEAVQSLGLPMPRYEIVGTSGPEHDKRFIIEARVGDRFVSRGAGSSKKNASQEAALLMIQQLKASNPTGTEA